jgi:hypothetical protein
MVPRADPIRRLRRQHRRDRRQQLQLVEAAEQGHLRAQREVGIEDTAGGKTVVNRWKPGDVEFESLGSSHSARNVGGAVDVVLVALKP